MPVIGTFSAVKDGYAGTIRTLTISAKVSILANDRKESEGAPDFRIMAGTTEIGAAWRKTKQGSEETYLRVKPMTRRCRNRSGAPCWRPPRTALPACCGDARRDELTSVADHLSASNRYPGVSSCVAPASHHLCAALSPPAITFPICFAP